MSETLWAPVAGRYGRTRDGRKVGPMIKCGPGLGVSWQGRDLSSMNILYLANGSAWDSAERDRSSWDLVSEWSDDLPAPSQPIDFSKIKVGDEIELRATVCAMTKDGRPSIATQDGNVDGVIAQSQVLRHIPSRRPVEIGCKVKVMNGIGGYGLEHATVLAIDGDEVWIKYGDSGRCTERLHDLAHVDDAP